jgi:hypothetical protein
VSESYISAPRSEILTAVGDFFGFGRNQYSWTREQIAKVTRVLRSGERQFSTPPSHSWNFLKNTLALTMVAGTSSYTLPDNFFRFLAAGLSFATADSQLFRVRLTSPEQILEMRQLANFLTSVQPEYAAVVPSTFDGTSGERYTLQLFPTPIASGTLSGIYQRIVDAMTDSAPYAMGGGPHSETLLAACLAAAELERDKRAGPMKDYYNERLAASIEHDKRSGPKNLGTNNDASDDWPSIARHNPFSGSLSLNGVSL